MKKEFKGTPGNWSVGKSYGAVVSDQKTNRKRYSEEDWESEKEYYGGYIICESIASNADAQLIAAAPELLEAIKYYFHVLKEVRGEKWDENPDHVLDKFINAYNKALGHDNNNQNSSTNN